MSEPNEALCQEERLQALHCLHQLFAQADGIALRNEHHAVERVGYHKYRQRVFML